MCYLFHSLPLEGNQKLKNKGKKYVTKGTVFIRENFKRFIFNLDLNCTQKTDEN